MLPATSPLHELRPRSGRRGHGLELRPRDSLQDGLHSEDGAVEEEGAVEAGDLERDVGEAGEAGSFEGEAGRVRVYVHRSSIPPGCGGGSFDPARGLRVHGIIRSDDASRNTIRPRLSIRPQKALRPTPRRRARRRGAWCRPEPARREGARAVERVLLDHHVLFFPEQSPTVEEHVAFGRHFGELEGHPHLENPTGSLPPEVFELSAKRGGVADEWHSDLTCLDSPALYSILHMVRAPAVGGDTMLNPTMAYDELSPPIRDLCDGLTAIHDGEPHGLDDVKTVHPVVRSTPRRPSGCSS